MSKQNMEQALNSVDDLLSGAFDQALSGPGNQLLVDRVMVRIARRQRMRTLILSLTGIVALVVCMLGAAPLFELLPELFSGVLSSTDTPADRQQNLPMIALAVGLLAAGTWLLLEEATG